MLNKKLAGLLLIPAIIASVGASHALSDTASQTFDATLGTFLDIQAITPGAVTTTTITPDTGVLQAALVSKFQVQLNSATQALFLKATTSSSTNPTEVAFFEQGGSTYLVMSNTTSAPTTAAVADCKTATPDPTININAIAYPIASMALDNGGTSTFDNTKDQYDVTVNAGESIATTTTGTTPYSGTYSFLDTAGTYQSILTLSTTSL